jgi:hypothetical protein
MIPLLAALLLQDATELKLKFNKGDKARYVQSMTSEVDHGLGEKTKGTVSHETTYTMDVIDVGDAGQGKVKTTFERFKVEMSGPMDKKFDSSRPDELKAARQDPALKMYAALTGRSMLMLVTPRGKIEQTDLSELLKAMEEDKEFESILPEARRIGASLMNQSFCSLPEKAVKPGDTWSDSRSIEMSGIGKVVMAGTYTLEAVEQRQARIGVEIKITLEKEAAGGPEVKEGIGRGLILFDVAAGAILKSRSATHLVIEGKSKTGEERRVTLDQKSETVRQ